MLNMQVIVVKDIVVGFWNESGNLIIQYDKPLCFTSMNDYNANPCRNILDCVIIMLEWYSQINKEKKKHLI